MKLKILALSTLLLTSITGVNASASVAGVPEEDLRAIAAQPATDNIILVLGMKPNESPARYLIDREAYLRSDRSIKEEKATRKNKDGSYNQVHYLFWSKGGVSDSALVREMPDSTPEVPFISADFNDINAWRNVADVLDGKVSNIYFAWSTTCFVRWETPLLSQVLRTLALPTEGRLGGSILFRDAIIVESKTSPSPSFTLGKFTMTTHEELTDDAAFSLSFSGHDPSFFSVGCLKRGLVLNKAQIEFAARDVDLRINLAPLSKDYQPKSLSYEPRYNADGTTKFAETSHDMFFGQEVRIIGTGAGNDEGSAAVTTQE